MTDSIRGIWDLTPDLSIHIVEVHRLSDIGAVITHAGHGTSREGFDAEWLAIDLLRVDGKTISGTEVFDEGDLLPRAITKFEQLKPSAADPTARKRGKPSESERFASAPEGTGLGCDCGAAGR